jgi:cobalt-zinc-cadmium efflux system outer membrane protein
MLRNCLSTCALALMLAPVIAFGETDARLQALLQEADDANPEVVAARARMEAAARRAERAAVLPDPMLSVGYTNDGLQPTLGRREMTTLGVLLSQDLTRGSVRKLRGEQAGRDTEIAQLKLERTRLDVAAAVHRAYVALQRARGVLALLEEERPLWAEIADSARVRYEVGRGTQVDWLRARIEGSRNRQARAETQADVDTEQSELDLLLGHTPDTPIETSPSLVLDPLPSSADDLLAEGERVSPELRAAVAEEDRRRAGVALAQAARGIDLTLQAGYMNRGGLDPMWQVGIAASLPVRRSRVRAGVGEAQADLQASGGDREAIRRLLRQRTLARLSRLRSAAEAAAVYREEIVPQGRLAAESARASYEAGSLPLTVVLEAMASVTRDRAAYLQTVARHEQIRASLFAWSLAEDAAMPTSGSTPAMGAVVMTTTPEPARETAKNDAKGGM